MIAFEKYQGITGLLMLIIFGISAILNAFNKEFATAVPLGFIAIVGFMMFKHRKKE